jgi:hypothetical protein
MKGEKLSTGLYGLVTALEKLLAEQLERNP